MVKYEDFHILTVKINTIERVGRYQALYNKGLNADNKTVWSETLSFCLFPKIKFKKTADFQFRLIFSIDAVSLLNA